MNESENYSSITKSKDSSLPLHWGFDKKDRWISGESDAFSIYQESKDTRIEGNRFFDDFFLMIREPVIGLHAITESLVSTYYHSEAGNLIAFTSLFLCDFRNKELKWHGLNIDNSIGIIPRKTFSLRLLGLVEKDSGLPFVRIDNLLYIREVTNSYPKGTNFTFFAHFQPESATLLRNLVKLGRTLNTRDHYKIIPKIDSVLQYLPKDFLESFTFEEKTYEDGCSISLIRFTN